MSAVPLNLACGDYDRVWPLASGRVRAEGIDLNVIPLQPEECFWRMMTNAEFDVAELSLASYTIARAHGDDRFVAIPVFLSRSFRHSTIYLREDSDITEAADLVGRRVGVPEYQMTASVWTRALLRHDFDVDTDSITWCTGGLEQAGRVERQPLTLPDRVRVEPVPGTLSRINELFSAGNINIDAQFLQTDSEVGYVVIDVSADEAQANELKSQLAAIPGTLRSRVLY